MGYGLCTSDYIREAMELCGDVWPTCYWTDRYSLGTIIGLHVIGQLDNNIVYRLVNLLARGLRLIATRKRAKLGSNLSTMRGCSGTLLCVVFRADEFQLLDFSRRRRLPALRMRPLITSDRRRRRVG